MGRVQGGGLAQRKSVVVSAALLLLIGVDTVVLRGQQVGHGTVYFDRDEPTTFPVEQAGQPFLVQIKSPRRVNGEDIGFRLSYWVETPGGERVPGGEEIRTHRKRSFRFVPQESGEHELYVQREGLMLGSSGGSARVAVYANDRQLLPRLLELLPIP